MKYLLIFSILFLAACSGDTIHPIGNRPDTGQWYECIYVETVKYNVREGVYCWTEPK